MSKMKYSKKFIAKNEGGKERTYIIYKSFHNDYDALYRWFDMSGVELAAEIRDSVLHCITFANEEDEKNFLVVFKENVHE